MSNTNTSSGITKGGNSAANGTSQLPGVNGSQVIVSAPNMIKENSQISSTRTTTEAVKKDS